MEGKTAPLYNDLIDRSQHILIAGMTGSGKSVMINGMLNSILYKLPSDHKIITLDPKRVELADYANVEHSMGHGEEPREIEETLQQIVQLMDNRYKAAKKMGLKIYPGSKVHVFIDEFANLTLTSKRCADLIQSICQMGRASNIQVIAATQCPLASVIPTKIKVNYGITVGLHTQCAGHSRNIIGEKGCEELPEYGEGYIIYPGTGIKKVDIPMIPEEDLDRIIEFRRKS